MAHIYEKGEIVNVDLGVPPNEIKGHEQGYDRPCIIIKSFPYLQLAIIAPCTTKEPRFSHYTIVKILKNNVGLKKDSYVLCHQIRTISFDRIINKTGRIDHKDFLKIHAVLIDTLEL